MKALSYCVAFLGYTLMQASTPTIAQRPKPISREKLVSYLSKSVLVLSLNDYCKTIDGTYPGPANDISQIVDPYELAATPGDPTWQIIETERKSGRLFARYNDMLRLIRNVKPKMVIDAVSQWGGVTNWYPWELDWKTYINRCTHTVQDIKAIDSDIVVQAAVNEFLDNELLNAIGNIPPWVFTAFGLPVESRKFDRTKTWFQDYKTNADHYWYGTAIVPDISQLESKMFFYFLGVIYINMGCESIQFCQVEKMNNRSEDGTHWGEVFQKLRAYTASRPDIRFLLITGHTNGMKDQKGNLIFDYHSSPTRPSENGYSYNVNGGGCYIDGGQCWENKGKIYNSSLGGISPSGWSCTELPGLVFLDNDGKDVTLGGQPTHSACHTYNWDEVSWFALQDKHYRDEWLKYARDKVQYLDSNIFLALPVKRVVTCRNGSSVEYLANNPSALFPPPATINDVEDGLVDRNRVYHFSGYGQEDAIKEILASPSKGEKYLPTVEVYPNPVESTLNFRLIATRYISLRVFCSITNTMGQEVIKRYLLDAPLTQMDLTALSPGIYHVTVFDEDENTLHTTRIVKK
jgi:hypothetical protein